MRSQPFAWPATANLCLRRTALSLGEAAAWSSLAVHRPTLLPSRVWPSSHHLLQSLLFPWEKRKKRRGSSLVVCWWGLSTFTAEGRGSIPGWGTKIPQDTWSGTKKEEKEGSHSSGLRGSSRTQRRPARLPLREQPHSPPCLPRPCQLRRLESPGSVQVCVPPDALET